MSSLCPMCLKKFAVVEIYARSRLNVHVFYL